MLAAAAPCSTCFWGLVESESRGVSFPFPCEFALPVCWISGGCAGREAPVSEPASAQRPGPPGKALGARSHGCVRLLASSGHSVRRPNRHRKGGAGNWLPFLSRAGAFGPVTFQERAHRCPPLPARSPPLGFANVPHFLPFLVPGDISPRWVCFRSPVFPSLRSCTWGTPALYPGSEVCQCELRPVGPS